MQSVLSPFEWDEWFMECKNSGGTSVGVPYMDTSVERKFTFPMSTTGSVLNLFRSTMADDLYLSEAIENFNRHNPVNNGPFEIVEGSKATTVDKTADKRRMICVEPTCNMYLQQGLMQMMYNRMKAVGLNVETLPDAHKEIARESSITGSNATIDWSSASDCVSIELLRWLLPPRWFDVVFRTRSHTTLIKGESVKLAMISTMGNATTFPLETLVFWTYAQAVRLTEDKTSNRSLLNEEEYGLCSVFGDDCIVPTTMAAKYIATMESVGFIVNDQKSFYGTEQFRESCGGDYLSGFDVRPFYMKAPHSTTMSALEPWLYIIANSLLQKYILYFGELSYLYEKEVWRVLFGLFREYKIYIKLVPSFFPDDAGLKLSHDIQRFSATYPMKLSRIASDRHGTVTFRYCSFKYRDSFRKDDGIRYHLWLKKPVRSKQPKQLFDVPLRKIGGYVVAKGLTGHWSVPPVEGGL
jgi:hypothetical protein